MRRTFSDSLSTGRVSEWPMVARSIPLRSRWCRACLPFCGHSLDMEILLEFLAELILEVFVQGIFELGGRGVFSTLRKDSPTNPWLTICGYLLMGVISGAISVWISPMHLLKSPAMQILNLVITPITLGAIFEAMGRWRHNHDKTRYKVDRFLYGFTFALTMGLIRYVFAT
jgi:hypothetical protein